MAFIKWMNEPQSKPSKVKIQKKVRFFLFKIEEMVTIYMHITCISSYYYKSCWNKLKCVVWKKDEREEEKQRNSQSARFTPWRLFIMGIRGIIGQHTFPHSTQSKWAAGVALAITTMAIIMCILVALVMMMLLYIKHIPNVLNLTFTAVTTT